VGDHYIRITVFLAAVLFLVGIGSTFKLHTIRYALISIGSVLLVLAMVMIVQQPGLPG
jgi:NADH:ubiquinone oxidoreductase subunit K